MVNLHLPFMLLEKLIVLTHFWLCIFITDSFDCAYIWLWISFHYGYCLILDIFDYNGYFWIMDTSNYGHFYYGYFLLWILLIMDIFYFAYIWITDNFSLRIVFHCGFLKSEFDYNEISKNNNWAFVFKAEKPAFNLLQTDFQE